MMGAFIAKLVIVGVHVVVMLRVVSSRRTVPFVAGFTSYRSSGCMQSRRCISSASSRDGPLPLKRRAPSTGKWRFRNHAAQAGRARQRSSTRARTIIEHVSNSSPRAPARSICPQSAASTSPSRKHVLMLWLVADVRLRGRHVHDPPLSEAGPPDPVRLHERPRSVVEFVRDSIVLPNVGKKWVQHLDAARC